MGLAAAVQDSGDSLAAAVFGDALGAGEFGEPIPPNGIVAECLQAEAEGPLDATLVRRIDALFGIG